MRHVGTQHDGPVARVDHVQFAAFAGLPVASEETIDEQTSSAEK